MTVVLDAIWFFWRYDDRRDWCYLIRPTLQWLSWWMLSDSSDVATADVIVWPYWLVAPEDHSKGCNLLVYFLLWSDVPIGLYLSFGLKGSAAIFFQRPFEMERLIITLDGLFDDEQYLTWWSNVTVHYALVRCIIKYVKWYWGYFLCNCDILG